MDALQTSTEVRHHIPNSPCAVSRTEQGLQRAGPKQALQHSSLRTRRFASMAIRPISETQTEIELSIQWLSKMMQFPLQFDVYPKSKRIGTESFLRNKLHVYNGPPSLGVGPPFSKENRLATLGGSENHPAFSKNTTFSVCLKTARDGF